MRNLSDEAKVLVHGLWEARAGFWGRERRALALLERIEDRGEPMAVVGVAAFVLDSKPPIAERAARVVHVLLETVPNAELVWLDGYLREHRYWFRDCWMELTPKGAERIGSLEHASAVLAVCCSHRDGFVRERALRLLGREQSGFELPFLLLRANDWVEPIREVAYAAIRERLTPAHAPHFVKCLDLVYRLEHAGRGDHAQLVREVTQLLSASESAGALLDGLGAEDRRVRRLAYQVALESQSASKAVARGLEVDDPLIRFRCAQRARSVLEGDELRGAVAHMRRDPFMPVRREGMRTILAEFAEHADEVLRASLLDRNRAMREEARYHLSRESRFDAASFYRAALAEGGDRYAALCGLGETGAAEDLVTLERVLDDPTPRIRLAGLRGIVGLSEEAPSDRLLASLEDRSPKVSRVAASLLRLSGSSLDGDRLWDVWEREAAGHVRRHLLWLLAVMPKWTAGLLVLRATGTEQDDAQAMARAAVDRWLARYNLSFETPSPEQLEAFARAVETAAVDESVRAKLRHIVDCWKR